MNFFIKHYKFFIAFFVLVIINVAIYIVGPSNIIDTIGVSNGYLVAFIAAATAGFSMFTVSVFYSAYVALVSAGLNIWLLALCAGVGLAISDTIFFFTLLHGRNLMPMRWREQADKFAKWMEKRAKIAVPFIIFFYCILIPLSTDFLMLVMAIAKQKIRLVFPCLILGNIVFAFEVAYLAQRGYQLFWWNFS
ncbi:MAG: hypothetical protein WC752_01330 [Patescibacteria group bacterium]|jgi:hypothetical protein